MARVNLPSHDISARFGTPPQKSSLQCGAEALLYPEQETRVLNSDHGSGYLARVSEEYLRMRHIHHIYCAPHHPQTNGNFERFHETLKARMNLLIYASPDELRRTMQDFIDYYNYCRYHEAIGNVTPGRCVLLTSGKTSYAEGRTETTHD